MQTISYDSQDKPAPQRRRLHPLPGQKWQDARTGQIAEILAFVPYGGSVGICYRQNGVDLYDYLHLFVKKFRVTYA